MKWMSRKVVSNVLLVMLVLCLGTALWLEIPKMVNKAAERGLEEVVELVIPSVVHVRNDSRYVQGSGVAITKDIIITARHLGKNGGSFTVTLNDGTEHKASQAISSKKYDMCFIKLDEPLWPDGTPKLIPAKFASMEGCKLGTAVFVIGSPYGKIHFNSLTKGVISGLGRNLDDFLTREGYPNTGWQITFQTDAAGHPGNSGCPVFTMDGRVRGILVAGFSPVLIHVVPADTVVDDLEQIKLLFTMNDYYVEEEPETYGEYLYKWNRPRNPRQPIWEPFGRSVD